MDAGSRAPSPACSSPSPREPRPRRPRNALKAAAKPLGKGKGKGKAIPSLDSKKEPSDLSSSASASASSRHWHGVRIRGRGGRPFVSGGDDDGVQDLALPLGMSFAAIVSHVLDSKNLSGERRSVDHLSMICISALKESVTHIYGNRFDSFTRNFEKSFGSTLKALQSINETCAYEKRNTSGCSVSSANHEAGAILRIAESHSRIEGFQDNLSSNCTDNQLIIHEGISQHLATVSNRVGSGCNQSVLSTFEKSVMEQSRSNDLKAVEVSLAMKRLELKQSQLALNSYANFLGKVKLSMGISKASFKEEKLRNQMQDARLAELRRRCIDILVAGLILMCGFLLYGAFTFAYQRIAEVTSSCASVPKETKSWWVTKPMASFSSGWLMLRCHAVVLTRIFFGLLMILAVAYSVFQRSATSGPAMPITFILLLLGAVCGFSGKLCVDTLGGNGYRWLLYWEAFCLLHFLMNVFPSILYLILYGPVSVSKGSKSIVLPPYWIRRYIFYSVMLLVLPTLSGLLPFASLAVWKEHLAQKLCLWMLNEHDG